MITGRDFIVFSDDWGRHPFSCQHIMKHFLSHNRILWVNTIGMRNPRISTYDLKRSLEKIHGWFNVNSNKSSHAVENLTIINPRMTPYQNIALIRSWNCRFVISAVNSAISELDFKEPIVLTTLPNAVDYIGKFNESLIIYYCVDDFTHWPGLDGSRIEEMERILLDKADLICASAEVLCKEKGSDGKKIHLLAHGVDFEHFSAGPANIHSKFFDISHPIIGFFGALSPWLDFKLLSDLAEAKPNWSFIFIGPSDADVSLLSRHQNVNLVGKRTYAELPECAAIFDVGLIPFLITDMTVCVNPLKLLEYFSTGLPVVSSRLPEVEKYGDLVYIADTVDEYIKKIEQALKETDPQLKERRKIAARSSSWFSVAEKLSDMIETSLNYRE